PDQRPGYRVAPGLSPGNRTIRSAALTRCPPTAQHGRTLDHALPADVDDLPAVLLMACGDRSPIVVPVLVRLSQDDRELPGALGGVVTRDGEALELACQLVEVVLGEALFENRGEEFLVLGAGRLVERTPGGGLGELLGIASLQRVQERVDRTVWAS